jgi:copper chaperone CopZ
MCSNSINKALGRLDFVERIDANLKTYTFEIYFKINSVVDFGKIRKKVEDAGFSVSSFVATIHFNNVQLKDNQPVIVGSNAILFLNLKEQALDGEKQVKLLDKGFVSSVESKRMSLPVLSPGNYHGTI